MPEHLTYSNIMLNLIVMVPCFLIFNSTPNSAVIWAFVGFVAQYVDACLGMGYGTITVPILLLLDVPPLLAVPAILFSKIILNFASGGAHHVLGNVRRDIALPLVVSGILGTMIGVNIAVTMPPRELSIFIGLGILIVGFLILVKHNNKTLKGSPSRIKLLIIGSLSGFSNGISGGGYGPINTSGLILIGINPAIAVGSVLFAEAIVALSGVLFYGFIFHELSWLLITALLIGGLVATPIGALSTKKMPSKKLTILMGVITILLGALAFFKAIGSIL